MFRQLQKIFDIHQALGVDSDLHIVGGAVRDALQAKEPKDFDLATVLHPDEVERRLTAAGIRFVVTGIRRGTITAIVNDEPFEITTFRNPENETEFVDNIETDLSARDFTINAIAYNVATNEIVDPWHGADDLADNVLRCVRDPHVRFTEDPHRILRMIRFGFGAGRIVEDATIQAAIELVPLLKNVAAERIHDEFIKIVCSKHSEDALRACSIMGILKIILPELDACFGVPQNAFHRFDVGTHTLLAVKGVSPEKIVRMAALLHDIAKPRCVTTDQNGNHFNGHEHASAKLAKEILQRLKFSTEDIQAITELIDHHGLDISLCGRPAIRRLIRDVGDLIPQFLELKQADRRAGHVGFVEQDFTEFELKVFQEIDRQQEKPFNILAIDGHDIMDLGVPEGKEVGRLLKACQELVIEDPDKNNREILLETVKDML